MPRLPNYQRARKVLIDAALASKTRLSNMIAGGHREDFEKMPEELARYCELVLASDALSEIEEQGRLARQAERA